MTGLIKSDMHILEIRKSSITILRKMLLFMYLVLPWAQVLQLYVSNVVLQTEKKKCENKLSKNRRKLRIKKINLVKITKKCSAT